jgi:hypothetical protein
MPSIGQENLETVMIDFFGALRRGHFEACGGPARLTITGAGRRR